MRPLATVLALAFWAGASLAQQPAALQGPAPAFLGKDLATLCEANDGSAAQTGCLRFLQGALAMYELAVNEGKELTWFCAPREAPAGLLRRQFLEYAAENADAMKEDAIKTVRAAFTEAFSCQE